MARKNNKKSNPKVNKQKNNNLQETLEEKVDRIIDNKLEEKLDATIEKTLDSKLEDAVLKKLEDENADSSHETSEGMKKGRTTKIISLALCSLIIVAGFLTGFMNERPVMSEIEQRNLAVFPDFSMDSFFDGSYFSDINLWYSDSYPLREQMIGANSSVKDLYGIKTKTRMIGTDVAADDIPALENVESISDNNAGKKPMVSNSVNKASVSDDAVSENTVSDNAVSANSVSQDYVYNPDDEYSEEEAKALEADIKNHIQQNLYVKDGAAYSKYYFSEGSANKYIAALEGAAKSLEGKCNVINILVPNQSGAQLPYNEMIALGGSNQIDAIHYYYNKYENVYTVDTIDTLRQHQDEYLYFRTDHHWTSLGAYYVYRNFCALKGWEPHELSYFQELTFDPFLGSFYSQLQDPDMKANPDYVKAYIPHGTNSMVYWDGAGVRHDWQVITDVSKWNAYSGYCAFVGGDKPLAIIDNPEIRDGSACLVIKESYGNCFIPFLVDHYQTVYIMDCRYSTNNYVQFVLDNNIQDLIFINNITIIGSGGLCNRIASNLEYGVEE